MRDPILAALYEGKENYRRKFHRAPSRMSGRTKAYDEGVLEGIRWATEVYTRMKLEKEIKEWEPGDE